MNDRIRILLVDDSPYFLEAARDFLYFQKTTEVVDTAIKSDEALAKSLRLKPDVILLDLNLGNRSGLELIPLLKAQLPHTKIIVLTIMNENAYRAASIEAGADAFVNKMEMSKSLMPAILQQMEPPAAEQIDRPPVKIEDDQEP